MSTTNSKQSIHTNIQSSPLNEKREYVHKEADQCNSGLPTM